jgi:AcrR family transcriptional regulator
MPAAPKKEGRRAAAVAATRAQILDAAEHLFALEGIETVSLRRIGVAAGAANHFAVQYHFGDKAQLMRAIFERRLPALEARRVKRLAALDAQGRADDVRTLMDILLRPLAEEVDADGRHRYAAFLLGLHRQGAFDVRANASDLAPVTTRTTARLHAANGSAPVWLYQFRLDGVVAMFLDALMRIDRRRSERGLSAELEAALVDDAIAAATAAFTAPEPRGLPAS